MDWLTSQTSKVPPAPTKLMLCLSLVWTWWKVTNKKQSSLSRTKQTLPHFLYVWTRSIWKCIHTDKLYPSGVHVTVTGWQGIGQWSLGDQVSRWVYFGCLKCKRRSKISAYRLSVFEYKRMRLFLSVYSMYQWWLAKFRFGLAQHWYVALFDIWAGVFFFLSHFSLGKAQNPRSHPSTMKYAKNGLHRIQINCKVTRKLSRSVHNWSIQYREICLSFRMKLKLWNFWLGNWSENIP